MNTPLYVCVCACVFMYICIHKKIYWNDKEVTVQQNQKWLAVHRKLKYTVVAQSTRLDISAGLQYMLDSQRRRL